MFSGRVTNRCPREGDVMVVLDPPNCPVKLPIRDPLFRKSVVCNPNGKMSGIVWTNRFLRVGLTTWNLTPSMKLSPFRALSCCKSLRNFACRPRCFRDLLYSHRKVMTFLLAACSPSLPILSRSDSLFRSCSRRSGSIMGDPNYRGPIKVKLSWCWTRLTPRQSSLL